MLKWLSSITGGRNGKSRARRPRRTEPVRVPRIAYQALMIGCPSMVTRTPSSLVVVKR